MDAPKGDAGDAFLKAFLAERDAPCPCCGYNVRGLSVKRCPECNQELELRVGLVEPKLGAYLAALAGPLAGTGMAALFFGIVMYFTVGEGPARGREAWPIYGVSSISAAILAALLVLMLRRRTRVWFRRAGGESKALAAIGCWAVPVGCIVWFIRSLSVW